MEVVRRMREEDYVVLALLGLYMLSRARSVAVAPSPAPSKLAESSEEEETVKQRQGGYQVNVTYITPITVSPPESKSQPEPAPPSPVTEELDIWFSKDSNYARTIRISSDALDASRQIEVTVFINTYKTKCVYVNGYRACGSTQGLGGGVEMTESQTISIPATTQLTVSADTVEDLEWVELWIHIPLKRSATIDCHEMSCSIAPEIDVK